MKYKDLDEQAIKDFKPVKYYPFENTASSPFILTSDPLGYLEAWLDNSLTSIQRDTNSKKEGLKKAKYFTQLSKDFYISAQLARMPSKGTLMYYSFINLVKVYLILNGHKLEKKIEHHGLSLPSNYEEKLKLSIVKNGGISIFEEFAKSIGKEIKFTDGLDINLSDLINSLPEVHEIGYALNLFPNTKRRFLPVEVVIRTTSTANPSLYYTISYEKRFDSLMNTNKFEEAVFNEKLEKMEIEDETNRVYYKSKFKTRYTKNSDTSWKICYPKLIKDMDFCNLTPMLTKQGYRFYINLEPTRLHRLSSLLGFAYYIGTVARYRPTLNETILKGKYQSIINEAMITCPSQFFYLMVSHITKQVCAIPMAKID